MPHLLLAPVAGALLLGVAACAGGSGPPGTAAQVLIRGPDAQWRAAWIFGTDPLPTPPA